MHPQSIVARFALAASFGALAACGSGAQSVPNIAASTAADPVQHRDPQGLRAFAATCSATPAAVEIGNCTNIELSLTGLGSGTPAAQVPGFHPADLQSAYNLPSSSAGGGQTIGIVVVGTDPTLESDLAVYRKTFGLPACSTASGCLQVIAGPSAAPANIDWAHETATDIDMASAVCPNCNLLVVQVASNTARSLILGDGTAVRNGATVINNSFAIPESAKENSSYWYRAGVPIVAAAGDAGYAAANWPAAATNVISVGATTLSASPGTPRGWAETAWSGTSSACSAVAAKPAWQIDSACTMRTVADVAAVGDPNTPVAVYDSYLDNGWVEMGGTSVAAPIVAGVIALAGNAASLTGAATMYANPAALFPVTSGSNGTCAVAYLCTAGVGYNAPAGIGSPNGTAAF
jgi:subtilase family serine protease